MDLFSLAAKISLDSSDYTKGIGNAEGMLHKLGEGAKKAGVAIGATLTAAAGAVGSFAKSCVDAYAEFEQLEGGVKKLFGSAAEEVMNNAQQAFETAGMSANQYMDTVTSFSAALIESTGRGAQKDTAKLKAQLDEQYKATKRNLDDQYTATKKYWDDKIKLTKNKKTKKALQDQRDEELKALKRQNEDSLAAMKAHNKEMIAEAEAANKTSVKSEESLSRAAKLADIAVQDMADNANTFGTDIASIQAAYAGFAKQNYTMLDNLKLGFSGSKEGMQSLLDKAEELTGKKFDISNFADIVEAIHAVQKEMKITGTTANEASGTISGSIDKMKAAWENLKIEIARPDGNVGQAIENLTTSFEDAAKNWMPAIERALSGIGEVIKNLAPVIAKKLPELINTLLPNIISGAADLVNGLITGVAENLPTLISSLKEAAKKVWESIKETAKNLGGIIFGKKEDGSVAWPTWEDVKEFGLKVWNTIKEKAKNLAGLIFGKKEDGSVAWPTWDDVKKAAERAWNWIKEGVRNLGGLVFGRKEDGTVAWPDITKLVKDFTKWWNGTAVPAMQKAMVWVLKLFGMPEEKAQKIAELVGGWWKGVVNTVEKVLNWALHLPDNPHEAGEALGRIIKGWWNGIKHFAEDALNWVLGLFGIGDKDGTNTRNLIQNWWYQKVVPLLRNALDFVLGLFGLPSAHDMMAAVHKWWNGEVIPKLKGAINYILNIFGLPSAHNMMVTVYNWWYGDVVPKLRDAINYVLKLFGLPSWQAMVSTIKVWWKNVVNNLKLKLGIQTKITGYRTDDKGNIITDYSNGSTTYDDTPTGGGIAAETSFAKGDWNIPYDMLANLHRGEMVLTASQARMYRNNETSSFDVAELANAVVVAIREGMDGATVNSYLDGKNVTGDVNRRMLNQLLARRFAVT